MTKCTLLLSPNDQAAMTNQSPIEAMTNVGGQLDIGAFLFDWSLAIGNWSLKRYECEITLRLAATR